MIENNKITRDDIYALSRHDLIIYDVLRKHSDGLLSWEEALITCVYLLSEKARRIEEIALDAAKNYSAPLNIST